MPSWVLVQWQRALVRLKGHEIVYNRTRGARKSDLFLTRKKGEKAFDPFFILSLLLCSIFFYRSPRANLSGIDLFKRCHFAFCYQVHTSGGNLVTVGSLLLESRKCRRNGQIPTKKMNSGWIWSHSKSLKMNFGLFLPMEQSSSFGSMDHLVLRQATLLKGSREHCSHI